MSLIFWALLSLCILLSVDLLSYSLRRSGWRRFASTFFLFYAQIVSSEFVLGALGILTSRGVILFNLCITAVILWLAFRIHKRLTLGAYFGNLLVITKQFWRAIHHDNLFLILAALFLIALCWILFLGAIFPPLDFDGNSYHLAWVAYAMQSHSIADPRSSLLWLTGYPKGGELMEMWNVIVARNDAFADLSQVPFLLLGVFSLYKISTAVGVKSREARFVSLLYIFFPIVFNQLKTTYIDVMLCALFFAVLAMVVERKRVLSRFDLIIVGIIYSLLIAIKDTGLFLIAATLPLLLFRLYEFNGRRIKTRLGDYSKQLALVAAPISFGLYWYVKNWILYGSPFYPFGLKVLGISIFPGQTFQALLGSDFNNLPYFPHGYFSRIWFVWTEQHSWFGCMYNYDSTFAGLGPIWFVVLIPAIIAAVYISIKQRNKLFWGVSAAIAILFLVYPFNYYTRYTMFIAALGIYSLGIVFSYISRWTANLVKIILVFLAFVVLATNFTLCNYTPDMIKAQYDALRSGTSRGPAFATTLGEAYVYIENIMKPGQTVAYDSRPYFIYALWKPNYSNHVTFVPASTNAEWVAGLKAQHVNYVFTTIGSKEYHWIQSDGYKSVYKDQTYEIYQVSK